MSTEFPELGQPVPAVHPSTGFAAFLRQRRSVTANLLGAPGPDEATLDDILQTALRVPDHRKVAPFRYIVVGADQRDAFGHLLWTAAQQRDDEVAQLSEEQVRSLAHRAPTLVAVISSVNHAHKTPEWEQILSAGVVCYNVLLAASAHGFSGQWLSEWLAYDETVLAGLGLEAHERIAGYLYLGTAMAEPKERGRPSLAEKRSYWQPAARS